jgi:ABC-type polysaccharide/polyol phosphate export permease
MTTERKFKPRVYEANRKLPPVIPYLVDTFSHLQFAYQKARLDLRGAHKDTWFGRLWNVLNPLLLAVVYFLLVVVIFGGGRSTEDGMQVLTQIVGGLFLFGLFSGSISLGARSIVGGGSFVMNTRLPRMILPIGSVISAFLTFLPSLAVYAIFHLVAGYPIGFHLLWTIPIILILTVTSLGMAMVFATLNVYFRDVASFLPYVIRIWLYLTPIIYMYSRIPEILDWTLGVNPIGMVFAAWQQVLFDGTSPSWTFMGIAVLWALVSLTVGALMFMRREREFAVRI